MSAATSNPLATFAIRPGIEADHRRVFGDWLNSFASSAWAKMMTPPEDRKTGRVARVYWDGHHDVIERLLSRAELWVGCWPEDPSAVVGWVCAEPARRVLHFVSTKFDYRRGGVARRLLAHVGMLDGAPVTYSHRARMCHDLAIPANWKFDPYAAFLEGT